MRKIKARKINAQAPALLVAVALTLGVALGVGWALLDESNAMRDPLQSCRGTQNLLETHLKVLNAAVGDTTAAEVASNGRYYTGWPAIQEILDLTACDPAKVVSGIPWNKLSEGTREILMALVATWSLRVEIPNLPERAAEIRSSLEGDGEEALPTLEIMGEGRAYLVVMEENCDCLEEFASGAKTRNARVFVSNLGAAAAQMALINGWTVIGPEEVSPVQPPVFPAVIVFEDGVAVDWLIGAEALSDPYLVQGSLFHPLNKRHEMVPSDYLYFYGTCDGIGARGVVQNATSRPIHVAVTTFPAVVFDEDGAVLNRRVTHDLGTLNAWEYRVFDVDTGQDEYLAPCQLQVEARYADGEVLGDQYQPEEVPREYQFQLSDVLDLDSMPVEIQPEGFYPRQSDLRPKAGSKESDSVEGNADSDDAATTNESQPAAEDEGEDEAGLGPGQAGGG